MSRLKESRYTVTLCCYVQPIIIRTATEWTIFIKTSYGLFRWTVLSAETLLYKKSVLSELTSFKRCSTSTVQLDTITKAQLIKTNAYGLNPINFVVSWDFYVCSVFLIDTHFVLEAEKFIAVVLAALSAMVAIETPCVNVLTKIDLLSDRNKALVSDFIDTSTREIVDCDTVTIWNERHRQLTKALAQVIEDYSIVKFVPLNSEDEESIEQLLIVIDTKIQYGEDLDVKDRYPKDQGIEERYRKDEYVED